MWSRGSKTERSLRCLLAKATRWIKMWDCITIYYIKPCSQPSHSHYFQLIETKLLQYNTSVLLWCSTWAIHLICRSFLIPSSSQLIQFADLSSSTLFNICKRIPSVPQVLKHRKWKIIYFLKNVCLCTSARGLARVSRKWRLRVDNSKHWCPSLCLYNVHDYAIIQDQRKLRETALFSHLATFHPFKIWF